MLDMNATKQITMKEIKIPHLKYTIQVRDLSELKGVKKKGGGYTAIVDENTACIFIEDLKETVKHIENIPHIAHEVMHVIQIICENFGMSIENEQEHTAYLMFYILEEIIKYDG